MSEDLLKKAKRRFTGWEKIFAAHITSKGLMSGIHKNYSNKLIRKAQLTQFLKMGK